MHIRPRLFAAIAIAIATPAAAVAPNGDPVLYWNELMLGASFNPGQTRPAAILNIALHDAVNATVGKPNKPWLGPVVTFGGDSRAAAAVAARNVLITLYPARTAEFDGALTSQLALIPDGAAKANGIATGAAIAAATIANRADDGAFDVVPYTPSGLPGRWAPTPPGFLPAAVPQQATMDSWLGMSNDQFRLGPPPALDSAEYAVAFTQVHDIGSEGSLLRTDDQSKAARFWAAATGPGSWIRAVIDESEARGLSTIENAAMLGLLTTAIGDATIAVWDTKYHYDYWRPVTAIQAGGETGWLPYITTPNHPSYAAAHAAVSFSAATVLSSLLGPDVDFSITAGGITRGWASFDIAAQEAAVSRLWGGIHWSFDNEAGLGMGRAVGAYALRSGAFAAVPEPASWALLVSGFGLIGLIARRHRERVSVLN